jgi:hypothetical protein
MRIERWKKVKENKDQIVENALRNYKNKAKKERERKKLLQEVGKYNEGLEVKNIEFTSNTF